MKPSLQLRIGQQLTMTPQLQQAIRLLQLSSLDLQAEVQEALETNPMLDVDEDQANHEASDDSAKERKSESDDSQIETHEALTKEVVTKDLPVDTQWENWDAAPPSSGSSNNFDNDERFTEYQGKTTESLQDHLIWQMQLTPFSEQDQTIATAIIDAVNDDGYLESTLDELIESLGEEIMPPCESDDPELVAEHKDQQEREILVVLKRIQQFDPVGVASRNLRECLMVQLAHLGPLTDVHKDAELLIRDYMDELGSKNYKQIMRKAKFTEDRLREAMKVVQTLNPRPGDSIVTKTAEYVVPDVYVYKEKGQWVVELNPDSAPKLRINEQYASLIKRADSSPDNTFLQNNLQEAKWFIKSLLSRNDTLLNVTQRIVEFQQGFFEYGEEAMRPLVLSDIAEAVEMHESTISRVTTQKYMHTPRGIFELKYFFSSHVSTASGGECSSTAIKALIKKLVAAEPPTKPLSDSKLAKILEEQGIKVARRTIAKYREALAIPPSNERKSLM